MFWSKNFKIDELVFKQRLNPWVAECGIQFFTIDLFDFASNTRLRLSINHTLTNLKIVTNISICEKFGRWHFSQTFLKQIIPIGIINVPTTYNHNIKIHGINIHNSFHSFCFLIRKFSTYKWFKFQNTSKLVLKSWSSILLMWTLISLLIAISTIRNHGVFDKKTKPKTNHFYIWSIWPISHIR